MDRDAGRARSDADLDGCENAGNLAASRIAKRGHLVDVDAETRRHSRLPEMFLHGAGDFGRPGLNLVLIPAFHHDPEQRLGAGVPDEEPALTG